MIGFFPDPFLDELSYSIFSRYHERAGYKSKEASARDLFGNGRAVITIDLPSRWNYLIESLPPGHSYSREELIYGNTFLPFFSPFLPPGRLAKIYDEMCRGDAGGSIHGSIGILTSGIRLEFLNFCTVCVKEDPLKYRQPYWHRLHQLPGIIVCPTHNVFLEQSQVHVLKRRNPEAFVTAKQALTSLPPARPIDISNPAHQMHLRIARDAEWLLANPIKGTELDTLRRRYLGLLLDRKLASFAGVVRITNLQREFREFYSDELLAELQCSLDKRFNWLIRLVQNSRSTQHPIQHLLLMQFLGCSAKEFFSLPEKKGPFGKGPWPCLNRASEHYREERIQNCEIGHTQDASKRLMGTFHCDCGFVYRRIGADESPDSRYRYTRAMIYGPVWEAKLRELYSSRNNNLNEKADQLGVSRFTVEKYANRLLLTNFRKDVIYSQRKQKTIRHPKGKRTHSVDFYRKQWLRVIEKNPKASRIKLRTKAPAAYIWLIKHDKEWFETNSPERRRSLGPPGKINWQKRDKETAKKVRPTAERLMAAEGRPVRVSKTSLARELGVLSVAHKRGHLIPQTIKALKESSESVVDFAIRRVEWARHSFLREKAIIKYWSLVTRAALSYSIAAIPDVKDALHAAITNAHLTGSADNTS